MIDQLERKWKILYLQTDDNFVTTTPTTTTDP